MYKYIGAGWVFGLPARDITADEFAAFDKDTQKLIKTCGLYELVKAEKISEEK